MRSLALCLCFSLIICGCSTDAVKLVTPTPVTIALTLGEWIIRDNKRVFVVEVESMASTVEAARAEVFKIAVAKAVGSLVLTEREIKNNQLIRDDFYMYSSGFVEDYEIKSEMQEGALYKVIATVWVSENKIADRLRLSTTSAGKIEGDKLAEKLNSYNKQAEISDNIFRNILSEFPSKTFLIRVDKHSTRIKDRALELIVPFQIQWDPAFINAIEHILIKTREGNDPFDWKYARLPSVIALRKKEDWFKTFAAYHDRTKEEIFIQTFVESRPVLYVEINDIQENSIYKNCFEVPELSGYLAAPQFYAVNTLDASFAIFGDFVYESSLTFKLDSGVKEIQKISAIKMRIVKLIECVF